MDSAAMPTPVIEPEDDAVAPQGQLLPNVTADESAIGWGDREDDSDRFYLEQRPPHYKD